MSKTNRTGSLVLLWLAGATASASELPQNDDDRHLGVATCAGSQCHGSAVPRQGSSVLRNEYVTWTQDDPHSRAFQILSNDVSLAMAARLGLDSATTAGICLDCHADNVPAARRGEKFQLSDGVGCEACHGGAENWLASHYNTPEVDHAANIAAGLYPTDSVDARAELCFSCHLGTTDKFATHRIMAAGHPRLAFELDTFTELWRTAGRQPHYRVDGDYDDRKETATHSYTWAVGVIAEASARMDLVLDESFDTEAIFPELGLYDCHGCHRSMKTVAWRALPRHGGAGPGLPFLNDGSLVMVLALARAIDPELAGRFEPALAELHVAASRGIEPIRAAAANLGELLAAFDARVTPGRVRADAGRILRELLATGAEGNYIDYASAEQAFMAVQMFAFETGDATLVDRLEPLGDALEDDERYRPARFRALLARLDDRESVP